jgi:hypothetical protein
VEQHRRRIIVKQNPPAFKDTRARQNLQPKIIWKNTIIKGEVRQHRRSEKNRFDKSPKPKC